VSMSWIVSRGHRPLGPLRFVAQKYRDGQSQFFLASPVLRRKPFEQCESLTDSLLFHPIAVFLSSVLKRSARSMISHATETLKRGPAMLKIGLATADPASRALL
jgi:hypothetical protein